MVWALAVATTVGFLGWLAAAARRECLRVVLRGRGRRPLVAGVAVGAALSLPAALLLHGLTASVNLPVTGGFLAVAAAGFAVLDRGFVPSLVATGVPIALLRFASRGCGDTPSGLAAVCVPTPPEIAALQAVAGALAVSALGYVVGRSALLVGRSVAPNSPAA
jgi:hypothetical protein